MEKKGLVVVLDLLPPPPAASVTASYNIAASITPH